MYLVKSSLVKGGQAELVDLVKVGQSELVDLVKSCLVKIYQS